MTEFANPSALVDTDWLASNVNRSDLRVNEMDTDQAGYDSGHLPNAVFWPAMSLLDETMATISKHEDLSQMLGASGIEPGTRVIAVHGQYRATSGWLYWFFRRLGHENVHVLDVGREKWIAEGRPLETNAPSIMSKRYPIANINQESIASLDDVKAALTQTGTEILDVRTRDEFEGRVYLQGPPEPGDIVGHIPGATHLYYEEVHRSDGTFKSRNELIELFKQHGISPAKTVLPYCAIGGRSGHIWFVLTQLLGFPNVQNYDGSWREWSTMPGLPIER